VNGPGFQSPIAVDMRVLSFDPQADTSRVGSRLDVEIVLEPPVPTVEDEVYVVIE
jgi:hypothetical protein